jgi:prophage DNA circulation protein
MIYNDIQSVDDGNYYGRFFASGNPLIPFQRADTSIAAMTAQAANLRDGLAEAITTLNTGVVNGDLGVDLLTNVQAVLLALANCAALANDQINILGAMATFSTPYLITGTDALGMEIAAAQTAIASVIRVAALYQLALAVFKYTPTSQTDASSLRLSVGELFDNEMVTQATNFCDTYYNDLNNVRLSVIQYLAQTGNALAPMGTFTFGTSLPSLVLAYRLYQDSTMEPDLVARNLPIDPGFCPLQIEALIPLTG